MEPNAKTTVALVDDHKLMRNALAGELSDLDYEVIFQADNGEDMIRKIEAVACPGIILLDINMPVKDGFESAQWLKMNHPQVRILALSMLDDEESVLRMLKCGARGYILKDSDGEELKTALNDILKRGYHYSELVTNKLIHSVENLKDDESLSSELFQLTGREIEFLKFATSELTYKEIAEEMHLSLRTVDGYRDALFQKLNVKNRVGLAIFALKHRIVIL